jgi:redox-sensitive bicupin YhaK (pirin superfamily)
MEKVIHNSDSRPEYDYGWLKTRHTFSFARYYNPERMHFGKLRVLNDDIIQPGTGFDRHSHDNMEIVSIPLSGSLEHTDSAGHKQIIHTGEVQIMSAGTGIYHSEYNSSKIEPANFLQIWIYPKVRDIQPRYDQKKFNIDFNKNQIVTVVSPEKSPDTLWINQDAFISMGYFDSRHEINYSMKKNGNGVYIFIIEGAFKTEDKDDLTKRDAVGFWDTDRVNLVTHNPSKLLFIEVPMA